MAVTTPTCASGNAAGTAIQDYMTAFHAAFAAAPGGFTISNVVGGGTPTSFTVTHSAGWQINYRVSGGAILSVFAPAGGIASSAAPGTPTNSYAEDTILPAPSGTSTRWQFAQYGDAILFAINGSANTFSVYAFHQGAIHSPGDADNASLGLGTLAYIPTDTSAGTAFLWHCSSATGGQRKSYLRLAAATWASMVFPVALVNYSTQVASVIVNLPVCAPDSGAPSTTGSPCRGLYRYLQVDTSTTAGAPLSVRPSTASNQGWLRLNSSATTTRQVMLWNKTVTP